jgi:glycosyltransferase involved in cell wall biosynthesis
MRILLFAPNYLPATRYGGPVRSAHGLASAMATMGHDVHVVTTNVDGPSVLDVPLGVPVDMEGVRVRYFATQFPRRIYYAPTLGRMLADEVREFDIVHINGLFLWPGPKAAAEARRCGVPLIVSPRGMLIPELLAGKSVLAKRLWIKQLERRALAGAAAIHLTSDEEADGVRRAGLDLGLALAPLKVIGNGVDLPIVSPTVSEIEAQWAGIAPGRRVAFLGRLDWMKGVDLAIAAVLQHPEAQLLLAGPDQIGLRAILEPRLTQADGACRGRFVGAVEGREKWAFLAGADVLLAPSVKESFGIAVAEALAIGTPVICTAGVGAASIIRRIDPACVVERTPEALGHALAALLADGDRRARYRRQAQALMAEEYVWPAIAQQMLGVYEAARVGVNGADVEAREKI